MGYPPGNDHISHQTGSSETLLQNAIFGGYVSSLEGISPTYINGQYIGVKSPTDPSFQ